LLRVDERFLGSLRYLWKQTGILSARHVAYHKNRNAHKIRETQAFDKEQLVSPSPCCDVPFRTHYRGWCNWRSRLLAHATYILYDKTKALSIKSSSPSDVLEVIGGRNLPVFIKMAPNPQKGVLALSYFALSFIRSFKNFAILAMITGGAPPGLRELLRAKVVFVTIRPVVV